MISGSQAVMLAAAFVGTAAVGVVAWRAISAPPSVIHSTPAPVTPPPVSAVPPSASLAPPTFDVVRVAPTGEAVVAGRTLPRARVTLLDGERSLGDIEADANGEFTLLPLLTPGEHLLSLRVQSEGKQIQSAQTVAVAVAPKPGEKPLAAVIEPDKPTRVLSAPAESKAPQGGLAIRTAEADREGAFFASGTGPADTNLRIYLNGAFVADVKTAPDGAWTLRVERGMAPGHYEVRADLVDAGGQVSARVEVPFDYPAQAAPKVVAADGTQRAGEVPLSGPGVAVVPEVQSVTVMRGDSLWRISRKVLGQGGRFTQIYEANTTQIRDPNRIWPGQVLVTPQPAGQ